MVLEWCFKGHDFLAAGVSIEMRDLNRLSDEALAERAQSGSRDPRARAAASVLFGRYADRVYLWALRYVREHERAMDLGQDILLSAWRNLGTYRGQAKFYTWLFAITRNRCLNALRRPPLLRDEGIEIERMAVDAPDPDRELEEKLDEQTVITLTREVLDRQEQDALYLRCFERMPIEEITVTLGIPGAAGARSVLQRARRKLRVALKEHRQREKRVGDLGSSQRRSRP